MFVVWVGGLKHWQHDNKHYCKDKNAFILWNLAPILVWCGVFLLTGQKDDDLVFWSTLETLVESLGLKITHIYKCVFCETPCTYPKIPSATKCSTFDWLMETPTVNLLLTSATLFKGQCQNQQVWKRNWGKFSSCPFLFFSMKFNWMRIRLNNVLRVPTTALMRTTCVTQV